MGFRGQGHLVPVLPIECWGLQARHSLISRTSRWNYFLRQLKFHPKTYSRFCLRKKVKSLSRVRLFATPWTVAYQAPPSMGFSRQEYWSGLQEHLFKTAATTIDSEFYLKKKKNCSRVAAILDISEEELKNHNCALRERRCALPLPVSFTSALFSISRLCFHQDIYLPINFNKTAQPHLVTEPIKWPIIHKQLTLGYDFSL